MIRTAIYTSPKPTVDPGAYPVDAWNYQRGLYTEYWQHFDGSWLDDEVSTDVLEYPLQLNPFNLACMLHAGFLTGEVPDGSDPLIEINVEPWGQDSTDEERSAASKMQDFLTRVWIENNGRSVQQEAAIVTQVLGGIIFGVSYEEALKSKGRLPIRIDFVLPEYFFPVPQPTRYWELLEAFVCFELSSLQARSMFGIDTDIDPSVYQEHYSQDMYDITVNGNTVMWRDTMQSGTPPGGFVPYTYIPHIRAGDFYGISLLDRKLGLAKEINSRMADVGDIVSENAKQLPAIGNCRQPSVRTLSEGISLLDLGNQYPGVPEGPWIKYPASVQANSATVSWTADLLNTARTEAYTPPVCYGIDEGSQRSALTLALRMIPLIVHIRQERSHWSSGLAQVAKQVLTLAAINGAGDFSLDDVHNCRVWTDWAPILPRDRETEVNEVLMQTQANLLSPQSAIARLGTIDDIKTEMNLIKEWMEYTAETEAKGMMAQQDPFKGAGAGGTLGGLKKPEVPQPSTSKEKE